MQHFNFHLIPVTPTPFQELRFEFNGARLQLTLCFNSVGQFWAFDLFDISRNRQICSGSSLVCGVPLLLRKSTPYFLWCEDESGAELDPLSIDDLGSRCFLYIGEKT